MRGRFHQPIKSLGFAKQEDINRRVPDSASFTNSIPNNLFVSSLHSTSHHKEYFINPLTNHHLKYKDVGRILGEYSRDNA